MKTIRRSILIGIFAVGALSLILLSVPAEAYQNTHTLTQNDSVYTELPSNLAGSTLYLHGKAPAEGGLRTRINRGTSNVAFCVEYDGECCEDQGSFQNGFTYFHSTAVFLYESGTGIGMVTDNVKSKLVGCDTGQED